MVNFLDPFFASVITLPQPFPEQLPKPKFQIGQGVFWARVPSQGRGEIIGMIFASSISVSALGYHYAVRLDPNSSSHTDCVADWAFEEDLELLETQGDLPERFATIDYQTHNQG